MRIDMKMSIKGFPCALLSLFLLEARAAGGPSQPDEPSPTPGSVVISNMIQASVLRAREEQARNQQLILSNFMASRTLKEPEWPLVRQRSETMASTSAETNVLYGQATNGCRLGLRLETNVVFSGSSITIYVAILNGSDQPVFYRHSSLEIPWFCEFTVIDERGNELPPLLGARPYFGSTRWGDLSPGFRDEYEIRLDRIYRFDKEGKYFIYAKKFFSRVKSEVQLQVEAGPAVLQIIQQQERH
jgi:hypothetical protein